MTARDGIGAPRKPSTLERERLVLEEAERLARIEHRGLKYEDALRVLGPDVPTRKQVNYTLERLARAGLIERRGGYVWYITEERSAL